MHVLLFFVLFTCFYSSRLDFWLIEGLIASLLPPSISCLPSTQFLALTCEFVCAGFCFVLCNVLKETNSSARIRSSCVFVQIYCFSFASAATRFTDFWQPFGPWYIHVQCEVSTAHLRCLNIRQCGRQAGKILTHWLDNPSVFRSARFVHRASHCSVISLLCSVCNLQNSFAELQPKRTVRSVGILRLQEKT